MQTKLTLRMDSELIEQAKERAKRNGKSLSRLVADYFALLAGELDEGEGDVPPITRSLHGVLRDRGVEEGDYQDYLERKHG